MVQAEGVSVAATHLTKIIHGKNIVEYDVRLFKQDEAYAIVKHARKFFEWARGILPKE